MLDKYKVAAKIKNDNPEITCEKALEIAKEAVKIYFADNCTPNKAIEKAKEVMKC